MVSFEGKKTLLLLDFKVAKIGLLYDTSFKSFRRKYVYFVAAYLQLFVQIEIAS